MDPFVGYGSIARECARLQRRFIGFDVNPAAVRLARLISDPPSEDDLTNHFLELQSECQPPIERTYLLADGATVATHYLWDTSGMQEVWTKGPSRRRVVSTPTDADWSNFAQFHTYESVQMRNMKLFQNSRINAQPSLSHADFFTGRALHNIDILLDHIKSLPESHSKEALLLCLTSSIGQMSKMVFTITRRGKASGKISDRTEVGSWTIGFWRPKQHFEINVWNCFSRRVKKLIKACGEMQNSELDSRNSTPPDIRVGNCLDHLSNLPSNSINLVVTDPPHSDRIPYLELSELWNAALNEDVSFEDEIIISNAKDRQKSATDYFQRMSEVFCHLRRVLNPSGIAIILFNSRKDRDWMSVKELVGECDDSTMTMTYLGCFDCKYSARSVMQDNRTGGLKSDFGLVFQKQADKEPYNSELSYNLAQLPSWSTQWPQVGS